jgi:hypothetical protein
LKKRGKQEEGGKEKKIRRRMKPKAKLAKQKNKINLRLELINHFRAPQTIPGPPEASISSL